METIRKENYYSLSELINEINRNNLGVSFDDIYDYFKTARITVTVKEIEEFLNQKAKDDYVDMEVKKTSESNTEELANNSINELIRTKYTYNGYDLKYFNRYVEILREKGLKFCLVAVSIISGELDEVIKILPKDAINIQGGKIDGDSIQRLTQVILSNYKAMKEKVDEANNLETYLTYTVPNMDAHGGFYGDANDYFTEAELYPTKKLQIFDTLKECNDSSCLSLSTKQHQECQDNEIATLFAFTEFVLNNDRREKSNTTKRTLSNKSNL